LAAIILIPSSFMPLTCLQLNPRSSLIQAFGILIHPTAVSRRMKFSVYLNAITEVNSTRKYVGLFSERLFMGILTWNFNSNLCSWMEPRCSYGHQKCSCTV